MTEITGGCAPSCAFREGASRTADTGVCPGFALGTTNYTSYDNRDRLLTKQTPEGTLTYTYDAHGNVLTLASSNANGASMTYTYDVLNRLKTATGRDSGDGVSGQGRCPCCLQMVTDRYVVSAVSIFELIFGLALVLQGAAFAFAVKKFK